MCRRAIASAHFRVRPFVAHDDFFVFEPQVNATVLVIPHVGVELGGGYRCAVRLTRWRTA